MQNAKSPNSRHASSHTGSDGYFLSHLKNKSLTALSIGALGVVYGDIGTSPLYALNLMFFGREGATLNPESIYGGVSLVIWALTIVVAIKYAILVLRADNDGEGGVFALYGLLDKFNTGKLAILSWSLLIGAGLLLGDGIITPAISVLSAVEGIAVATPASNHEIILITLVILSALFAFQFKGTGGIGRIFGPILIAWFVVIAILGIAQIQRHPEIVKAFSPTYAIAFLHHGDLHSGLLVLGALMLVLTGGEAMYADMGHFGAKPIRISWFGLVYPALLLNYLGQGAFLLGGGVRVADNLFYSTVPAAWLYPMVVLATVATVIASQALISGAFSMTAQAIALGLLPRLKVTHTHHANAGQVYVPFINWTLFFGCALLVTTFGSSSALGSAYGLAVSGDMTITSVAMLFVACRYWQWNVGKSAAVFGIFAIIDSSFLIANTLKFWEGGFIPISIGFFVFITIVTWQWGRTLTHAGYFAHHNMALSDLIEKHRQAKVFIERSAILMIPELADADQERTPTLMQMLWNRTGILPRNIIFAQVLQPKVPYIRDDRYSVTTLERNERGSVVRVQVKFGFMEDPAIERVLHEMVSHKEIELPADRRKWIIYVAVENLIASRTMSLPRRIQLQAFIVLRNISRPAYHHFGLGDKVPLSAEIFPITVR